MRFLIPATYHELIETAGHYTGHPLPDAAALLKQMGLQQLSLQAQPPVLYIVDYTKKKYLFIDPTVKAVLGYDAESIREAGPLHFTGLWNRNDYKVFEERIMPHSLAFLRGKAPKEYPDFSFSFNYRIMANDKSYRIMLQRSTYFLAAENGYPLAAIGFAFDITHFKDNTNITYTIERVDRNFNNVSQECLHKQVFYPDFQAGLLGKREMDVLRHIQQGLSSKDIAGKMFVSIHTIHNHRKNILRKTGCKNTGELLQYASRYQLL